MAFPDGLADFRSDTVTRPTDEMRAAMASAEVGDDVYGEDPTVNALEAEAAEAIGMEAALFVPSGTQANQLAINLQTRPGDEVLCVERAHLRIFEYGAASALSGVAFRTVATGDGVMTPSDVEELGADRGEPAARLLTWENTHNVSGGTVVPVDVMEESSAVARRLGLAVHLDGARVWNAVAATGVAGERFGALADTVSFCFSKGLGAPVGSVLCGTADLIATARARRRRFGGGMRQAGVIAAPARIGLRDRHRLAEDHELASYLAVQMAERFPKAADPEPDTNMVLVDDAGLPVSAQDFQARLAAAGIRVGLIDSGVMRFVTHRDVDRDDVERVLAVVDEL